MEIGPIPGIRPVPMIKPSSSSPDLSGVFSIEFHRQYHDDDASRQQRAARGLEDEESDAVSPAPEDETAPDASALQQLPHSSISFFA